MATVRGVIVPFSPGTDMFQAPTGFGANKPKGRRAKKVRNKGRRNFMV